MARRFGSKRDVPDHRDTIKTYPDHEIPPHRQHTLRKYVRSVYNQGGLDSCTSNVLCGAYGLELMKQSMGNKIYKYFDCSRLFLYYNSRIYESTTDQNVGVAYRDVFKAMKAKGVCTEELWPYNEAKFSDEPLRPCYDGGKGNTILRYSRLQQNIDQFRACLREGYPFTVGFEVYDSFKLLENDVSGRMSIPTQHEIDSQVASLHAVLAVGYDDDERVITILNSWGSGFGDNGYFYMPYEYILNDQRAYDFWKIEEVGEQGVVP